MNRQRYSQRGQKQFGFETLETRALLDAAPTGLPDHYSVIQGNLLTVDAPIAAETTTYNFSNLEEDNTYIIEKSQNAYGYSNEGRVILGYSNNLLKLHDPRDGTLLLSRSTTNTISGVSFSPDGRYLFIIEKPPSASGLINIHRLDRQTSTWVVKTITGAERSLIALDGNRFLTYEPSPGGSPSALTLYEFGTIDTSPIAQITRVTNVSRNYGGIAFDREAGIIYTPNRNSEGQITKYALSGNTIVLAGVIPITGSGSLSLSADGKKLFYGKLQIDLATENVEKTYTGTAFYMMTTAGNLGFDNNRGVYNLANPSIVGIGALPLNHKLIGVTSDQKYVWTVQGETIHQYRLPGSWDHVLENDTDADGQALTASLLTAPSKGVVSLDAFGTFSYSANPGQSGSDSFTYRAFDGVNYSAPITVQIAIWPLLKNTTETAYEVTEDTTLAVNAATGLVKGATDELGFVLQTKLVTTTAHGTLNLNPDGSFTYTPSADFFGTDEFQYTIMNDSIRSTTGTVRIKVNATQDDLLANDDVYKIYKNQPLVSDARITAATTSSNFAGLRLIKRLPYDALLGPTLTPSQIVYSSQSNLVAIREYRYVTILNAASGSIVTTLTIPMPPATTDLDFTADGKYLFVGEAASVEGYKIHRYDVQNNTWTSKVAPSTTYRIEAVDATRYLSLGSDQFVNLALNDFGATPTASVTQLTSISAGYQGNMTFDARTNRIYYGEPVNTDLVKVFALQGNTLTKVLEENFYGFQAPAHLGGVLSDDGRYYYYGSLQVDTATVSTDTTREYPVNILAGAGNIAFAQDRYFNALTGEQLGTYGFTPAQMAFDESGDSIWLYDSATRDLLQYAIPGGQGHLKNNDIDIDQESWATTVVTGVAHGTLVLNVDGSFLYTPALDFVGTDSFTYRVTDAGGFTDTATVTINVLALNSAPVPLEDNYTVHEDQVLTVNAALGVLANDTDYEGTTLTVTSFTPAANGTLTLAADGSFVYTPNPNFNGSERVSYFVKDADGQSYAGLIKITVQPVPDAPVAVNDAYQVNEDSTLGVTSSFSNLFTNDTDIDGVTVFTATLVTPPALGNLTWTSDGKFTYLAPKDYFGTVSFEYRISDGLLLSNVATVTITVKPVNDAPLAVADRYLLPYTATSLTINAAQGLLVNDSDIEGDAFTAVLVTNPVYGTVALNSDGSFTYTKTANFALTDTFTYRARDTSNSVNQTVTIELDTGRIVVGTHQLLPNKPNQQIPLYITGGAPLNGFNLRLQLGDGLAGSPEPIITAIDFSDKIWSAHPYQLLGGPIAGSQQFVQASIVFDDAEHNVISSGKLVTLTVDTTGFYGGNFSLRLRNTEIGEDTDMFLVGAEEPAPLLLTNGLMTIKAATVTNRQTFYNNSYFDGNSALGNAADLNAIAADKSALRPNQPATFQNYTSYSKGINGVIIDVQDFHYLPTLDEFEFRVGNTTTPGSWQLLTTPPELALEMLADGKLRLKLIWPDGLIINQWLEVTIKAKGALGLPLDDVFYFGNSVGETGNQTGNSFIDGSDFAYVRDNPRNFLNRAPLDFRADINRDSIVDINDLGLVRDHPTNFITSLKLWTPPTHVTPDRPPYTPPQLLSSLAAESANNSNNAAFPNSSAAVNEISPLADTRQSYFAALNSDQADVAPAHADELHFSTSNVISPDAQKSWFSAYARMYWEQLPAAQNPSLPTSITTNRLSIRKL
jgi:VCBS repeat-containing protein